MERASPPTERVVRVLNVIASRPRERFTLTEISKQVGISMATCLGIVAELTRSGYLTRDPGSKTYGLGPSALNLGQAARNSFASLELVRPELQRLTDQFGYSCTASAVIDDDIVVLERTGLPGQMDRSIQVGQRYPYAPPSGIVFAAWQSDSAIDHWLAAHSPVSMDREHLQALVRSSRRLGYIVEKSSEVSINSLTLLAGLTALESSPAVLQAFNEIVAIFPDRYMLDHELEASAALPVTLICAPTYSTDGTPELLLGMLVFGDLTPEQIRTYGSALCSAALGPRRHDRPPSG